jgi:hypothetical protein
MISKTVMHHFHSKIHPEMRDAFRLKISIQRSMLLRARRPP